MFYLFKRTIIITEISVLAGVGGKVDIEWGVGRDWLGIGVAIVVI